jgi:hypothetical protein
MLAQGVDGGSQACTTPPGLLKKSELKRRRKYLSQHISGLGMNKNVAMGPGGAQNQE